MQITVVLCIIITVHIAPVIFVNGYLDYDIIEGYFKEKRINYACVIGCFSRQEQLKTAKHFLSRRPISILNINRISVEESLKTQHEHIGVVLDGDCQNADDFLIKSGKLKYFDVKHHWLILHSTRNFTAIFENVALYINADIQVVYPEENVGVLKKYTVEDVYNPAYDRGGELIHYPSGFYNELDGYVARERQCKYWVRRNMTGITLKTVVVLPVSFDEELHDYLKSERNREINTFNRFHYNLMCSCQHYYNFSSNITLTKSWGYKNKDNTFDGLVGALERKTIDYGSSPLFVRSDRAQVIEYGRRTWTLRAAFIFRNPRSRNSLEIFIRPLSPAVWILIACSAILLVLLLKLSYLYERRNTIQQVETSWSYLVVCLTGALCQQGMTKTPSLFSGRIVTLFMFLFSLLIYQFYSASLVSHLLMKPMTRIKTVEDILKSNMRVGCEDILYNRDYFKYTTDKPSQELYYKKILGRKNVSNFLTPEVGLALVSKGRYAFHVELATAYPIITNTFSDKAICQLREVEMYRTQPMHANVQKHSPYRDMFDTCLQRLAEHGILARELRFWHPPKPECIHSSKTTIFTVGLDDFYPALVVLAAGICFSMIILSVEILVHHKDLRQKKECDIVVIYPFIE